VIVNNTGKGALKVLDVKFTGINASEFRQTKTCYGIQSGANCTIEVVFAPTVGGSAAASLASADNGQPQE
jgi:hypothetical protein